MIIQYYGDYCFKITTKPGGRATEDIAIWTDPYDKSVGLRAVQGQADIVLLSHTDGVDAELSGLKGESVVLDAPGEYAAKGVNILGLPSFRDVENGASRGQNTMFVFQVESMSLCFLGALGHELAPAQIEKMDHVDILFVPIGNHDTLATKQIDDLIRKVEPALVVPMHYQMPGMKLSVGDEKAFCNEIGNCPSEKQGKLNIKKKDLEGKSMEIVFLERA
jgi:hypothetical protein